MVAVAIAFLSLFTVLASGTILAVVADDTVAMPNLEELPLDTGAVIVDSMTTCTESACDGFGVVVMGTELGAGALTRQLVDAWEGRGWEPTVCVDRGEICFANGRLRISVRNWDQVDPLLAPAFLEEVADRQLDPDRLLFVHYYRCGIIHDCKRPILRGIPFS